MNPPLILLILLGAAVVAQLVTLYFAIRTISSLRDYYAAVDFRLLYLERAVAELRRLPYSSYHDIQKEKDTPCT